MKIKFWNNDRSDSIVVDGETISACVEQVGEVVLSSGWCEG